MKKILTHILILVMILAGISAVVTPQVAHAQDTLSSISTMLMSFTGSTLTTFFFYTGGIVLNLSNKLLYISGTLLNAALNETIHLSDLVKNVPAIELTWRTVRDFSSIFFIFFLLYGSIATILGLEGRISPKKLIVNIVIWGILMNFSLFFTKVIIDASNVVTLGFYNAIAPDNVSGGGTSADGGISNIFAQQLRVVTQWDPRGAQKAIKGNFEAKAGPAMWLGSAVMFIAAGSFFVVTLMLIIRIALLILLMAFSPVYFISRILPQTSKLGDSWLSMLSGQVLFAPAYLAVIYIVMKIVSSPTFSSMLMAGDTRSSFSQAFIDGGAPGVIMNYIIVIVLLNAALVVATKFGGHSYKYASEGIKLLKKHGATVTGASFAGRNLGGRAGAKLDEAFGNTHLGNSAIGRSLRSVTTGAAAKSKWGGSKSFVDTKKEKKERDTKRREIDLVNKLRSEIKSGNSNGVKDILGTMNSSEIAKLDKKILKDYLVVQHLGKNVLDQIEKGDRSDSEKVDIKKAQIEAFNTAFHTNDTATLKNIISKMSGKEIAGLKNSITTLPVFNDRKVVEHLKESQLKEMEDLPPNDRRSIFSQLIPTDSAYGYANSPRSAGKWNNIP